MNLLEPFPYILDYGFTVNPNCRTSGYPGCPAPEIDEIVRPSTVPQKDVLSRFSAPACAVRELRDGIRDLTEEGNFINF